MFKKMIAFFQRKKEEEREHKELGHRHRTEMDDVHRMFHTYRHSGHFINIVVAAKDNVPEISGIVCNVVERCTEIDVLSMDGTITAVNLLGCSYTVQWCFPRGGVPFDEYNWMEYSSWLDVVYDLDKQTVFSLIEVSSGNALKEVPKLWPYQTKSPSSSSLPLPHGSVVRRGVHVFGYNAFIDRSIAELGSIYADLKNKSLVTVKDWYNARLAKGPEYLKTMLRDGDLVKRKDGSGFRLAIVKSEDTFQVAGGVVYDHIALNLETNEFELIMSYHYFKVGRVDDLG